MDMILHLKRKWFGSKTTLGEIYVDDEIHRLCFSLEDADRSGEDKILQKEEKVYGETCIPTGKYQVILDFSNRFGRSMPHLLDVPYFNGIRIHKGNTDKDVKGCIAVGKMLLNSESLGKSAEAFDELYGLLESANRQGKVWIEITNDPTEGA